MIETGIVKVLLKCGDVVDSGLKYLYSSWTKFEHEFALGGRSGDNGGIS